MTFVLGGFAPSAAQAGGGYPHDSATDCSTIYGQYSWCISGSWLSPRGYAYRNCTDWVAYRLESQGITNHVRSRGNGKQWDDNSTGVTITSTPEVGDAAVWNSGTYGHVAYVEEIRPKAGGGYEARVSEYNQPGDGTYRDDRWVTADNYVDFNGVGVPLGGSGTPVAVLQGQVSFGNSTDIPVTGDWNGDGYTDIGTWRAGYFYLRHADGSYSTLPFGNSTDIPVTGDWNGDGVTEVGTWRNGVFYFAN